MWNHAHFSMVPGLAGVGDVIDLLDERHGAYQTKMTKEIKSSDQNDRKTVLE